MSTRRPTEQNRTTDCCVCGETNARLANGEKPEKGMGAGLIDHLAPGTHEFAFRPRGPTRAAEVRYLCPTCSTVFAWCLKELGVDL